MNLKVASVVFHFYLLSLTAVGFYIKASNAVDWETV